MLYSLFDISRSALAPANMAANHWRAILEASQNARTSKPVRQVMAAATLFERATRHYGKPAWRIHETLIEGQPYQVEPVIARRSDWCELVNFKLSEDLPDRPKLLIAAPLSGHFATLLRDTVEAFLPSHDVYITAWADAKMQPLSHGRFDLDDYIDEIIESLRHIGGGAHVVAVCQPGPAVLAAIAMLAEDGDPARPASMTFMGSPIDTRQSPTLPNLLAQNNPLDWFETNMIHTVPDQWPGSGRRVFPGFIQISSFMQMNWTRHIDAHLNFFAHLVDQDETSAEAHRTFYDEYFSVLDMTEEFYLQTVERVFQAHHLPRGRFRHRDTRQINLNAIDTIGLMTVEGEHDDISGLGQTRAAHDLCPGIPDQMRCEYVQSNVGHFGLFHGARFNDHIAPKIKAFQTRIATQCSS